jgi:alkylation response protein AidB-like acyl-CoA dehydrogenase
MCHSFAKNEFEPHASQWDAEKIFPREALRKAASLGLGGMFVKEELGGSGFSRHDGSIVFEALAQGCASTTAYLSIHNMCAWVGFGLISRHAWFESFQLFSPST